MEKIYVLTLWEPWATLFVHDLKKYETRPKPTSHKGIYLIHAAARMDKFQKDICQKDPFASALNSIGINNYSDFTTGAIIGGYQHKFCAQIKEDYGSPFFNFPKSPSNLHLDPGIFVPSIYERSFGDWKPGRYAWAGSDKKVFKEPIPYKNGQGYYRPYVTKRSESKESYQFCLI